MQIIRMNKQVKTKERRRRKHDRGRDIEAVKPKVGRS